MLATILALFSSIVSFAPVLQSSAPGITGSAGAAIAVGLAALGAGFAERGIGAAGVGAIAEDDDMFGRVLILTVLPETLVILALVVVFLPLYYVLPPVSVSVRHALPGTVFAAVGWVLLQVGFFYYTGSAGQYAAYGLLGAVLLFVTFLYLAGVVLLVGAVLNAVLDR